MHDDLSNLDHVHYQMIFPKEYAKHRCFYNLAKINGEWGIVNVVDRGFQVITVG